MLRTVSPTTNICIYIEWQCSLWTCSSSRWKHSLCAFPRRVVTFLLIYVLCCRVPVLSWISQTCTKKQGFGGFMVSKINLSHSFIHSFIRSVLSWMWALAGVRWSGVLQILDTSAGFFSIFILTPTLCHYFEFFCSSLVFTCKVAVFQH